jgi:hypothetical protein
MKAVGVAVKGNRAKQRRPSKQRKPQPVWVTGCAICGKDHEYGRCPAGRR